VLWVGVYFVVRCYLASLANCDWTLKQSRLIATATVVGCSESGHFYLVAERCAPFLDRGRLYSCSLLFTFVTDLSGTKTASRRNGELRVTTTYYTKIMDKHLRPQTFSTPDDSASSAYRWKHWKRILETVCVVWQMLLFRICCTYWLVYSIQQFTSTYVNVRLTRTR